MRAFASGRSSRARISLLSRVLPKFSAIGFGPRSVPSGREYCLRTYVSSAVASAKSFSAAASGSASSAGTSAAVSEAAVSSVHTPLS